MKYNIGKVTITSEDMRFLYGVETGIWIDGETSIEDTDYLLKVEEFTVEQVIERFQNLLTNEQLKKVK